MEEKRKNKRLEIDVKVEIERIDEANITTVKYMEVEVTNISKTGLAFREKDVEFEEFIYSNKRIE